jgi:hypothetical protein
LKKGKTPGPVDTDMATHIDRESDLHVLVGRRGVPLHIIQHRSHHRILKTCHMRRRRIHVKTCHMRRRIHPAPFASPDPKDNS